jgi:HEAT repeat protein
MEQAGAAGLLGKHKDPRAVQLLIAVLREKVRGPNPWIFAAIGLGGSRDPRALDPLLAALSDASKAVRVNVVNALGLLGDSQAIAPLRAFAR